jgi:hypothetical protein
MVNTWRVNEKGSLDCKVGNWEDSANLCERTNRCDQMVMLVCMLEKRQRRMEMEARKVML